jgi:hypothetical protein
MDELPGTFAAPSDYDPVLDAYLLNGVAVSYTPEQAASRATRPLGPVVWSNDVMAWINPKSLDDRKLDHWAAIKKARDAALAAPIVTAFGTFDADTDSQAKVTGAILMLQLAPPGTTLSWTLHDNTTVSVAGSQMAEVGLLMGAQVQTAYTTSQSLRAQIDAATTVDQLASIVWPT